MSLQSRGATRLLLALLAPISLTPRLQAADPPAGGVDIAEKYGAAAQRIITAAAASDGAYRKLEVLCDDIGNRLSGSEALERAIDWAVDALKRDGQENVRKQPVTIPKWVRGRESLTMIAPRELSMPVLGLGGSVGTPPEGVTAELIVVADKDELTRLGAEKIQGKIVLFNCAMPPYDAEKGSRYGATVQYRVHGARWAAEHGAVAALVRSVTARSLRSLHTGGMHYGDAKQKIPTAAITVEDAERLSRMQARGIPVKLTLKMEARDEGEALSANVIAELRGREKPDEVVVMGGHIDSWDVGQGAHDDGAGVVISMEALNLLRKLDLRPRRTIRVVLWTNEENGLAGGKAYAKEFADELDRHVAAIESDSGGFAPRGFSVGCKDADRETAAVAQLAEILKLLAPLKATRAGGGGGGADIGPMKDAGVPLLSHDVEGATYFDYHHTEADTLDKVDAKELSQNVAAMAIVAYVLADMDGRLGDDAASDGPVAAPPATR